MEQLKEIEEMEKGQEVEKQSQMIQNLEQRLKQMEEEHAKGQ